MPRSKSILKYFIEFTVIVLGVSASFWVEEYRETLQNKEEKFKVLNNGSPQMGTSQTPEISLFQENVHSLRIFLCWGVGINIID